MKKIAAIIFLTVVFFTQGFAQKKANIIFTHDVHSFLKDMSKAKVLIDRQLKKDPNTLIVDAGDFSMGTLYQTVFETQAPELVMFGQIGYDAFTFGNHEFDYGAQALANMLDVARTNGNYVPNLVLCNVDWEKDNEYTKILKEAVDNYGIKDYMMVEKGDVKIAIIGVFGADSFFCSPTCELTFTDQYEAVKNTVAKIKENEEADLIVCLSHSGLWDNPKKSEDEILAKKVPELDVIISGHTHTVLEKPIVYGDTIIASAGAYTKFLGNISLTQKENGRWSLNEYKLDDLKLGHPKDPKIEKTLAKYDRQVDREYLANFGFTSNQVLTESTYDMDINHEVGYLMADAIYDTVSALGEPVDVVVVPEGVTRGTYKKGPVTISDVFESYSLGIGADGLSGYPLIEMYFTDKEMFSIAEIDCSLSGFISYVRLYTSGFTYEYNPNRFILDKVTGVYITELDGSKEPVEPGKLYRVITDLYTGQMIGSVIDTTHGLVSIIPKDKNGNPITDWNQAIVYDKKHKEVKGWIAIAKYLDTLKTIPDYSHAESDSILRNPSMSPAKLLKNPSKVGLIIRLAIIALVLILALVIFLIVFSCKKHKAKKIKK